MADEKISGFSDGGAVAATDEFVIARSTGNKKIAGNKLPGFELDYVQITADVSVTGSSGAQTTVIDGNAISFDGSTKVKIEFFTVALFSGSAACIIELWDGASSLGRIAQSNPGLGFPLKVERELTPSSGSHTFHIKAWINGGSAAAVAASSPFLPAFYRVTVVS